uniref:Uncharacterized protein TCIL3000_7_4440 n=1 Tax=Trypanosoma congolense (strain IL3000) TaxID=1068625 RepID=G0UQG9_TRYCI|nr:unnamed protein product [Trypanosoma congolense IL3000]
MLQGNGGLFNRTFTIHFRGEVCRALIDCRTASTLRDLFTVAIPDPSVPDTSVDAPLSYSGDWVNDCICTFGGQRLSLDTLTEVAPLVLNLAWPDNTQSGARKRARHDATGVRHNSHPPPAHEVGQDEGYDDNGKRIIPDDIAKLGVDSEDAVGTFGYDNKSDNENDVNGNNSSDSSGSDDDDTTSTTASSLCKDSRQHEIVLPL